MGTAAIKHPVPDRDVKNYKRRLNPVWHRMLYRSCCTHTATAGVKGYITHETHQNSPSVLTCIPTSRFTLSGTPAHSGDLHIIPSKQTHCKMLLILTARSS